MQIRAKKHISIATAKLAIFPTDMLLESCSKFNFRQLFHSMSVANIANLAVIQKIYIIVRHTLIYLKRRSGNYLVLARK